MILGQVKTDEKSNEITAVPELLDMLFLKGCIVTVDALNTQKKTVEKIVKDKKADYVVALKGNHETLHNEVVDYYKDAEAGGFKDEWLPFLLAGGWHLGDLAAGSQVIEVEHYRDN